MRNKDEHVRLSEEQRIALITWQDRFPGPTGTRSVSPEKAKRRLKKKRLKNHQRKVRAETGIRAARTAPKKCSPRRDRSKRAITSGPPSGTCLNPRLLRLQREFIPPAFSTIPCARPARTSISSNGSRPPLDGPRRLITGSRHEIGYQAALMMLRAGAMVIATTRFPVDSARRYAKRKISDLAQQSARLRFRPPPHTQRRTFQ